MESRPHNDSSPKESSDALPTRCSAVPESLLPLAVRVKKNDVDKIGKSFQINNSRIRTGEIRNSGSRTEKEHEGDTPLRAFIRVNPR